MKNRYRLFRRRGRIYYCFDNQTHRYTSLNTADREAARQIVEAKNVALLQPALSREIGKAYLAASDPAIRNRTWQDALRALIDTKQGVTRLRWERAAKEQPFDLIRNTVIIETHADQFLDVLKAGTVSTNVHLRKLHNFCLDLGWLPVPVLPRKQWPRVRFKAKRAITLAEHEAILRAEHNPERRAFYALAWHLGAAQSDIAALTHENIDWANRTIRFFRRKTRCVAILRFSDDAAEILKGLPQHGLLFPNFSQLREMHRATEFKRACRRLCIEGVTLHSYRYAWAERAKTCGYPERFAQTALGHNSRAVHEAYAGAARPICPPLDDYERGMKEKVIPLKAMAERASKAAGAQG
ncbi:MAG TPA: tyrosine-type recombinase/integrase [Verrucomicrobiota bacterium]|nr:tyrosine-type recombinase/integrase [Verrucomicrobiota bacterium]